MSPWARLALLAAATTLGSCAGPRAAPTRPSPRPAAPAAATVAPPPPPCPREMILVEGEYCPLVSHRCLRWVDPKESAFHKYRCAEYAAGSTCRAPREHKRFCIDVLERLDPSSGLPQNEQSWLDAKARCEAEGSRVCLESEWTFACEGEEMRPYPYGWKRDASLCNVDRLDLLAPGQVRIVDKRARADDHPGCVSAFGVRDMAGNVAEWVSVDGFEPGNLVVQKGAWWHAGKHACRDAQGGHDKFYKGTETGVRCCRDARP